MWFNWVNFSWMVASIHCTICKADKLKIKMLFVAIVFCSRFTQKWNQLLKMVQGQSLGRARWHYTLHITNPLCSFSPMHALLWHNCKLNKATNYWLWFSVRLVKQIERQWSHPNKALIFERRNIAIYSLQVVISKLPKTIRVLSKRSCSQVERTSTKRIVSINKCESINT